MSKKELETAAAELKKVRKTPAQKMADQMQDTTSESQELEVDSKKKKTKNTAPFTVWTTPENAQKWRNYQKMKKSTLKTQNDFIVAAVTAYMQANPVTDEEKAAFMNSLDI